MAAFRALLPKELPAPLAQPCQQPGSSLELSALPAARRKLLFAREAEPGRARGAAGSAKAGSCAGERAPAHPQSRNPMCPAEEEQDRCWDVPGHPLFQHEAPHALGASSEPLYPNPPSSGSLPSRSQRVAAGRGEKSLGEEKNRGINPSGSRGGDLGHRSAPELMMSCEWRGEKSGGDTKVASARTQPPAPERG